MVVYKGSELRTSTPPFSIPIARRKGGNTKILNNPARTEHIPALSLCEEAQLSRFEASCGAKQAAS